MALACLLATLVVAVSPGEARAAGGLTLSADTTYRVNVETSKVDVSSAFTVRNVKSNICRGNTITRYFYDTVFFGVPEDAENISVQSGGRDVNWTEDLDEGVRFLEIKLPSRLFYQQSRTLDVAFSLDGSETCNTDPVRVNPAHLTMWAVAWGDPGRSNVRIEVPDGYELEWFGSDAAVEGLRRDFSVEGHDVWYAADIEDPDGWWVSMTGDRPSALVGSNVEIGDIPIEIRSWPGVDRWYDDVNGTLEEGLPALVDAIGLEWPVEGPLIIAQSSVPNRYGYGGWYFTELDEIEIGEEVDELLVLHEVSHAWFNDSLFVERWIAEGLADAVPAYVLRTSMDVREFPTVVNRITRYAIPLNNWAEPTFDLDDDGLQERWGYNASWWTIHQFVDEIGIEGISAVIKAASADEIAYRGVVAVETVDDTDDWHRFLDLLEEVGGSEQATELFVDLVVTIFDEPALEQRTDARTAYADLDGVALDERLPAIAARMRSANASHEVLDAETSPIDDAEDRDTDATRS